MFKKILFISAILATSSVAVAEPAPYVGASVGITTNTSNVRVINPTYDYFGGSYRGVPINVFVGYGGVLNQNFYLAAEAQATIGTADISDKNGLKTSYGYGISALPGLMLSDNTLAFLRIGVLRANFSKPTEMRTGFQFGGGLQTTVTQNLDVRGEYDYVAYRSVDNNINNTSLSVTPRADQFTVGLIYKFD